MKVTSEEETLEAARRVFELEAAAVSSVRQKLGGGFVEAVGSIHAAISFGNKVVVAGVGKCSHIGEKIAATLTSTGTLAFPLNSMNALHGDLGVVRDGDVVLVLSYSGETAEMVELLTALREFQVTTVAITGNPGSTLATNSGIVIDVSVDREACPLNLAPTASSTAMLVLGDALAMVLMERAGFGQDDFARFHPGGNLGRKLKTTAREMMRSVEEIAIVNELALIPQVLEAMTERRAGAAVVVGEDSRMLCGVFTHGDFVRAFRTHGSEVGGRPVRDLMTKGPVSVREDTLALDVLSILERNRIDDVIVVDADGVPVGVIDVQDLTRLKIV